MVPIHSLRTSVEEFGAIGHFSSGGFSPRRTNWDEGSPEDIWGWTFLSGEGGSRTPQPGKNTYEGRTNFITYEVQQSRISRKIIILRD